IKDAGGNPVGTITTGNATGAPDCIDVWPGTYTITETLQTGWTPTNPVGGTQTVTVAAGQTKIVAFGNHQTENGRICVVKFNDLDGDGKQGPNELPLSGWTFTIKDANGNVVGTITTGDLAARNCIDLKPGTYTVTETLQAGWTPTTPGGTTQTVTVVAGQTTTVIFGNRQGQRICVVKFNDLNGNGKQDPGEPLLNGWVFTVKDSAGNVVATLVSGTDRGCVDLKPGTYTVTETLQAGWTPTTPGGTTQTISLTAGQTVDVIFGNHRCCLTFTFLGGKIDNFSVANGATAEPVTPPVITATPAYFDATQGNRAFAHRFYLGTGNCIQSATLEIRIKALPGGSTNDTLGIKVPGSSSWGKPIFAIAPTGTWTPPKVKTVLFNLGAMPSGGGSTNLIAALNSIRVLDINIQDDTSVDYIKLVVVFCECVRN
ncbi:MAG TPA: SdrD B-like domain-containing protein, partial [Candidatus Saccharimonadales bacterium]|nr:SdrD B-like domain-containing protein [Candidatus Saccharimonadales bacterium]